MRLDSHFLSNRWNVLLSRITKTKNIIIFIKLAKYHFFWKRDYPGDCGLFAKPKLQAKFERIDYVWCNLIHIKGPDQWLLHCFLSVVLQYKIFNMHPCHRYKLHIRQKARKKHAVEISPTFRVPLKFNWFKRNRFIGFDQVDWSIPNKSALASFVWWW